jgi:hypothetical protein
MNMGYSWITMGFLHGRLSYDGPMDMASGILDGWEIPKCKMEVSSWENNLSMNLGTLW